MKTPSFQNHNRLVTCSLGAILALACLPASAGFLDSFTTKTGWKDTLNGGAAVVSGGTFNLTSSVSPSALTASIKTNVTVLTTSSNTLELRVIVKNLAPGAPAYSGNAVLGWVPTGGALLANGYAMVVGATNIQVYKDATVIYSTNRASTPIAPADLSRLILVLRMNNASPAELGDVTASHVRVSVYRNVDATGGSSPNLLFEWNVLDPGTFELGPGNAAVGSMNSASGATASTVSFDDLQAYDITYFPPATSTVLDDFSGPHSPLYSDFLPGGPFTTITQSGGVLRMDINLPQVVNVILEGTKLNSPTFRIEDGVRVEARIKVVDQGVSNPIANHDNNPLSGIAIFGYFPDPGNQDFSSLFGYFLVAGSMWTNNTYNGLVPAIAKDSGYVFAGKSANQFWVDASFYPSYGPGAQYVSTNVEFIQIFTGEGSNIRIEQRVEDLSKDVNDPNRIVYQFAQLDANFGGTPAYTARDGTFALINYRARGGSVNNKDFGYVIWDNLVVGQTTPITPPPTITTNFPASGAAFADTNTVLFKATHPSAVPTNSMVLTLNGIRYTNGAPFNGSFCKVFSSQAGFQTNMTLLMTNLPPDTFFSGTISATSDGGKNSTQLISFDTFRTDHSIVVESEEYNFNNGSYIDPNALLIQEGNTFGCSGVGPNYSGCSYNGQIGTEGVDFHDAQTSLPNVEGEAVFRTDDPVRTSNSTDTPRKKYTDAGGIAAGYYEVMVGGNNREINSGDWLNYTRNFPAGTYNIFLRESTYSGGNPLFLRQSQVSLNKVTSDPTMPSQTTSLLGTFFQLSDSAGDTGIDQQRTVPLTDSSGRLLTVRLGAPPTTLRVSQDLVRARNGGQVNQNYLVVVAVPDPGTLRPYVTSVSPPANSVSRIAPVSDLTQAVIANRDTTVDTTKIAFKMNGVTTAVTVTPTASGATVAWPLSATPATPIISNTLSYADSQNVTQVVSWTYSYPFLYASNSLPLGFLASRGMTNRTAWTYNNGNNLGSALSRAEQQLSVPPAIPSDIYNESVISMMNWDDNQCATAMLPPGVTCVPGLETGGPYNNIATETSGYMQLTAGVHRFVVNSDDGFQLRSGTTIEDPTATVLGFSDGDTLSGTFDFNVQADGLYPMRNIWYENGGYADYHLSSRDLSGVNADAILNDPGNPAGVVPVFLPTTTEVILYASSRANGTYQAAFSTVDSNAKTVTVAQSGAAQYYKLNNPADPSNPNKRPTITNVKKVGSNIVISYQIPP